MRYCNVSMYNNLSATVTNQAIEVDENGVVLSIKEWDGWINTGDINCEGRLAYPTFMDSSVVLPSSMCYTLFGVNIRNLYSVEQYFTAIRATPTDKGIRGFGFNTLTMGSDGYVKMKQLLDDRCPDVPAYVLADDLTNAIVNEYVLEILKEYMPISRDLHQTGLLDVQQIELLREKSDVFEFSVEEYEYSLRSFQSSMLSRGIGAIRVTGFLGGENLVSALKNLCKEGVWCLETIIYVPIFSFDTKERMVERYLSYGALATDNVYVNGVSITLDGSVDSGQAALYNGYEVDNSWRGDIIWNIGKLWDTVSLFASTGADININAYGDRAVSTAIQAYEATGGKTSYCISHAYLVSDSDIAVSRSKNITYCVEPNNVPYGNSYYEGDKIMLGDRIHAEYPVGRLLYAGLNVVSGGNSPTQTEIYPVNGVYRAARRNNVDDATPYRLLETYCATPYRVFGLADKCGSIKVGAPATFTVLTQDLLNTREELLCNCETVMTVINGKVRWENDTVCS